ncbi:HNH endonuclease signature motif containing protein [Natrinema sp. DC36]|uniref:HNH endonuclease n=1 Tax=Natrinema sp. DC36 TaxID=2878680 RepID=UPI001CEFEC67|nr:HNH endonuclease signature motif containing protein [Natrinema sp. DC36]
MGVVRREGRWRLEKQDTGFYEVTHEKRTEATITTPEYDPGMFDDRFVAGVPIYEADSAAEARSVFEDIVESNSASILPSSGLSDTGTELGYPSGSSGEVQSDGDGNLPPGGIALVMLVAGGLFLFSSSFEFGTPVFYVSTALLLGSLIIFGWAIALYKRDGAAEAWSFLTTVDTNDESDSKSNTGDNGEGTVERTPPAPQSLKDDLYFDRANQHCEWCNNRTDHPEVHHIEPRSEGGPNDSSNLIVLCPDCHRKADSGAISRNKLRAKVRRQTEAAM